jgi:aryl-alcohol dehydrogenase-like predicted oxidoreductase
VTVAGEQLFSVAQVTWNLLEPTVQTAAAEAARAGWAVLVKEAVANGRLAPGGGDAGPGSPLAVAAEAAGVTPDAIAISAALAQPWVTVVLSGAVSAAQLNANLTALQLTGEEPAEPSRSASAGTLASQLTEAIAENATTYWAERSARPWT